MKVRSCFLLIVFGMLTMGFVPSHVRSKFNAVESKIHRILRDKYNVAIIGTGGSAPDEIRRMMVCIESDEYFSLNQTRAMYVEMVEEVIENINKIKEVRPYVHSYPVDETFVNLQIIFRSEKNQPKPTDVVSSVGMTEEGIIVYMLGDHKEFHFRNTHGELYKIAHSLVQEQKKLSKS